MNVKTRVFEIVEKAKPNDIPSKIFDWSIIVLITLNIAAIIIESFQSLDAVLIKILYYFELTSVTVFTVEYLVRVWTSDLIFKKKNKVVARLLYMISFYALIDLFAVLPFYLPLLIAIDLRFIRVLRLFRILRLLKIDRYNNSLSLITKVIKAKKSELIVTTFITTILILFSACIMFHVENEAQPDQFNNILSTIWWAVATLTTVGYGDIYPITPLGRLISGVMVLLSIGIIALPTGIISSGFITEIAHRRTSKKCPHCGNTLTD